MSSARLPEILCGHTARWGAPGERVARTPDAMRHRGARWRRRTRPGLEVFRAGARVVYMLKRSERQKIVEFGTGPVRRGQPIGAVRGSRPNGQLWGERSGPRVGRC